MLQADPLVRDAVQQEEEEFPKMCRTMCCLVCIVIIASVGFAVDIYALQHGESEYVYNVLDDEYQRIEADIKYTHSQFRMKVDYFSQWTHHKHVSYKNASDEACDHDASEVYNVSDVCSSMKDLRDAGQDTYALYSTAISMCTVAMLLVLLYYFATKVLHKSMRKVPCRYLTAAFVFLAFVFFLTAWAVFYHEYIKNLNDVLDYMMARYWPDVDAAIDDWDDGVAGATMSCLLTCIVLCAATLFTALCFDKDDFDGSDYQQLPADDNTQREIDEERFL